MTLRRRRWLGLAALVALLLLGVLFAPEPPLGEDAPALSTFSPGGGGARGFYEAVALLGWRVSQHLGRQPPHVDSSIVYAVLHPPIPLTARETHRVLENVRAGAGLFLVGGSGSELADSLGIRAGSYGQVPEDSSARCRTTPRTWLLESAVGDVWVAMAGVRRKGPVGVRTFIELEGAVDPGADRPNAAALGFKLGRGRVGFVADPLLVTNNVVRACRLTAGVGLIELLEFVSANDSSRLRDRIVFDEFRHGYGAQPSIARVATEFLFGHPAGRTIAQAGAAAVVVMAGLMLRPATVVPLRRTHRRSSLEHVTALAFAYSRVKATRVATRLLVRGMRRRLRRASPDVDDAEFLRQIVLQYPSMTADAERVRLALSEPVTGEEFKAVGASLARIEHTVLTRI